MMDKKVVTFGEILLRLSPPGHQRLMQSRELQIHVGGAEANVAVALSNFGMQSSVVSKVPSNDLGQLAINQLRSFGVDTKHVARGGKRMGIYFLEAGNWARSSKVIYDRADSAMATAAAADFNLDEILKGAQWFHTSGITPAISESAAELTLEALKFARSRGITTSFDINFRQSLWDTKKAKAWFVRLLEYVDVYIGNTGHAGIILEEDTSDPHDYDRVFDALRQQFGFKYIACTIRIPHSASLNDFGAIVSDGKQTYTTPRYAVNIVDRVGTGDAFTAGLIYNLVEGKDLQTAADFGAAAAALKHTIPGDLCHLSVVEVSTLLQSGLSGQIVR